MKLAPILSIWGVGVVSGDLREEKIYYCYPPPFLDFFVFLLKLTQRGQFRATLCGEFSALSSQIMEDYICMTWLESKYLCSSIPLTNYTFPSLLQISESNTSPPTVCNWKNSAYPTVHRSLILHFMSWQNWGPLFDTCLWQSAIRSLMQVSRKSHDCVTSLGTSMLGGARLSVMMPSKSWLSHVTV